MDKKSFDNFQNNVYTKGQVDQRWHGAGGKANNVTATLPITSSGGVDPNISTLISTNKLVGRGTAGTGVMEEITLGANLSLSGTTLNATGGGGTIGGSIAINQVAVGTGANTIGGSSALNYTSSILNVTGAVFTGFLSLTEYSSISTPSAGTGFYYSKDDGHAWYKNSAGTDFDLTLGGSPGGSDKQLQFNNANAFGGLTGSVVNSSNGYIGLGITPVFNLDIRGGVSSNVYQRLSRLIIDDLSVQPMQSYALSYNSGVAYGSVAQWEMDRTATGVSAYSGRLSLKMYSDRDGTGTNLDYRSTPITFQENGIVNIPGGLNPVLAVGDPYLNFGGAGGIIDL